MIAVTKWRKSRRTASTGERKASAGSHGRPPSGGHPTEGDGRLAGQEPQRRWRWWWPTPSEQDQQAHLSNDVLAHWFLWSAFRRGAHKQKPRHRGAGLGGLGSVAITEPAGEAANPPPQRPAAPLVAHSAQTQYHSRLHSARPQKKPRQSAARLSDDVHRGWACRSSPRAFLPPRRRSANAPTGAFFPTPVMASGGLFALGLWPLDHVDMSAVGALKQQDRGEPVVEPGQLPGELHARPATTTDQPRLWLVVHVRIIGVRECRHGTGNIGTPRVG